MNRELEIRERVALYGLELTGHDREALDIARGNLEFYAYSDLRYLLSETARLRADLAAMTAERDAAVQHNRRVSSLPNCNDCRDAKSCEHIAPWGELVRFNCPLWRGPREEPQ